MPQKTIKKSKEKIKYENNPFFVASNGITLLFELGRGVGILLLVLSLISFFSGGGPEDSQKMGDAFVQTVNGWTVNEWLVAAAAGLIIGLALSLIASLFGGVSSYASYQLSRGNKISIGESFREAFDHLWSFLWLQVIIFVKTLLWTLLFIVPGIIMTFRYSLANTAFFDDRKNLRGNAAVKESLRLTKGAWLTTFSSNMLFNLLTFGSLSSVITTGVNAVLYRQFDNLGSKKKPEAHWLSWVTLALPAVIMFFVLVFLVGVVTGAVTGFSFSE